MCFASFGLQCSFANDVDPCTATPKEVRYSTPSNEVELVGHPQAAAQLADGRILALYEQNDLAGKSSVRLVAMNPNTGGRFNLCGSQTNPDLEISLDQGARATIVAVDLAQFATPGIVAVIAWTEGATQYSRGVRYQMIKADLCPVLPKGGAPIATASVVLSDDAALAWSPTEGVVWATFHDTRSIYRVKITGDGPGAPTPIVQGQLTIDNYRTVFASDGRGFAAWFSSDSTNEFAKDRRRLHAVLLGPGAEPRTAATTAQATAFELETPTPYRVPDLNNTLSVAARSDRYAMAFHGALQPNARPVAHVLEMDAEDGRPRGEAWRVDPTTGEGHGQANGCVPTR